MDNLTTLITGCGRSGTNFIANSLNKSGVHCGHEKIFHVYGVNDRLTNEFESSWYSVPYLARLKPNVRILHVVREPQRVMESFYRIGMFAPTIWQHVCRGHYARFFLRSLVRPVAARKRIRYVCEHRKFLKRFSSIFDEATENSRLNSYWLSWNIRIEEFAKEQKRPYFRVRLEDFESRLMEIEGFLGIPRILIEQEHRNAKPGYQRTRKENLELTNDVLRLAARYGY